MGADAGSGGMMAPPEYRADWTPLGYDPNSSKNKLLQGIRTDTIASLNGQWDFLSDKYKADNQFFKNNDITLRGLDGNEVTFSTAEEKYQLLKAKGDSMIDRGGKAGAVYKDYNNGAFVLENYDKLGELTGYNADGTTTTDGTTDQAAIPGPASTDANSSIPVTQGADLTEAERLLRAKSSSSILSTGI